MRTRTRCQRDPCTVNTMHGVAVRLCRRARGARIDSEWARGSGRRTCRYKVLTSDFDQQTGLKTQILPSHGGNDSKVVLCTLRTACQGQKASLQTAAQEGPCHF